jgi:gamma-glutamylaminecyclotransferase
MNRTTLFVYGSLKRGQRNHGYLVGQEFVTEAQTAPRYRLYVCGGYACLVEDLVHGVGVRGEIWLLDEEALRQVDRLEDAPVLYSRRPVVLENFAAPVAAYFYNRDVAGCVDCGACWP